MKEDQDNLSGTPRLYVESPLAENTTLPLDDKAAHYLKNVLRRADGSPLRVFDGKSGEFLALFHYDKKNSSLAVQQCLKAPSLIHREIHLAFAPIKKDRMDFMIEKSVELGATHFHPVLTRQTSVRDINEDRIKKQIIEAAEQCERLDIPAVKSLQQLEIFLKNWPNDIPLYAAIERENIEHLGKTELAIKSGLLIGPEGGFSTEEKIVLLASPKIKPVSLGDNILRAETAAIYGLSLLDANLTR